MENILFHKPCTTDDTRWRLIERERKVLENSWAKVFADERFPKIGEEPFGILYYKNNVWPKNIKWPSICHAHHKLSGAAGAVSMSRKKAMI